MEDVASFLEKNAIIIGIIILLLLLKWLYEFWKKRKEEITKIMNEVAPIKGTVVGLLICEYCRTDVDWNFYPIIRDSITGKNYIDLKYRNYFTTSSFCAGRLINYSITSGKGSAIEIGDRVKIYIATEIGRLKYINGMVNIDKASRIIMDNKEIRASGGRLESRNRINEELLNLLNDITLVEAIVDYDAYKEHGALS